MSTPKAPKHVPGTEAKPPLDDAVRAYRDDFAYSLDNRLILNWYPRRVLQMATGESLLELGLGHGYSAMIFARHFDIHTVIEGSSAVIRQFHQTNPSANVDIRSGYFEDFVPEMRYDHIAMGFVLEHVDDPGCILRRYRDFLNPGGSVFVAVPNCEALNKRFGYEAGLIQDIHQLSEADRLLGHQRLFTLQSLSELCRQAGYRIANAEGIFLKPITTGQIQKLELSEAVLEAMLKVGVHYPELSVGILLELRATL